MADASKHGHHDFSEYRIWLTREMERKDRQIEGVLSQLAEMAINLAILDRKYDEVGDMRRDLVELTQTVTTLANSVTQLADAAAKEQKVELANVEWTNRQKIAIITFVIGPMAAALVGLVGIYLQLR